jgi:hypothetical protein
MRQSLLKIMQDQETNNITKEQWDVYNEYFGINVEAGLKTGTIVLDGLVNATAESGANLIRGLDKIGDATLESLSGWAWSILKICTILSVPVFAILSIYSGCATAVFRKIGRDTNNPRNTGTNSPVSFPDNSRYENEYGFTIDEVDWLRDTLLSETHGGGRKNKRKLNVKRKTRKNKKKVTKRKGRNLKKYTKNKK